MSRSMLILLVCFAYLLTLPFANGDLESIRVAVVGAGAAGLTAAGVLRQVGTPHVIIYLVCPLTTNRLCYLTLLQCGQSAPPPTPHPTPLFPPAPVLRVATKRIPPRDPRPLLGRRVSPIFVFSKPVTALGAVCTLCMMCFPNLSRKARAGSKV